MLSVDKSEVVDDDTVPSSYLQDFLAMWPSTSIYDLADSRYCSHYLESLILILMKSTNQSSGENAQVYVNL